MSGSPSPPHDATQVEVIPEPPPAQGPAPSLLETTGLSGRQTLALVVFGSVAFWLLKLTPPALAMSGIGARLVLSYLILVPAVTLLQARNGRLSGMVWIAGNGVVLGVKMLVTMGLHLLERLF